LQQEMVKLKTFALLTVFISIPKANKDFISIGIKKWQSQSNIDVSSSECYFQFTVGLLTAQHSLDTVFCFVHTLSPHISCRFSLHMWFYPVINRKNQSLE
jgi:hypothetical protein